MSLLSRWRRFLPLFAALAILVTQAPLAQASIRGIELPVSTASAGASQLFNLVNNERGNAGLPPLQWRDDIGAVAVSWTTQMASTGTLAHNDAYFSDGTRSALGNPCQ